MFKLFSKDVSIQADCGLGGSAYRCFASSRCPSQTTSGMEHVVRFYRNGGLCDSRSTNRCCYY